MTTSTPGAGAVLPHAYAQLVDTTVAEQSVALQVSTLITTDRAVTHIPRIEQLPQASWTAEGDEIAQSDAVFGEEEVVPRKIAALSVVSSELAADSSPDVVQAIGNGMARDIAVRLDQAYFGNLPAPAARGLGSITPTVIDGASGTNLDAWATALSVLETVAGTGVGARAFVANPDTLLELRTLKDEAGSIRPLFSPENPTPAVYGTPVLTSAHVPGGRVYLIPQARSVVVRRADTTVARSEDAAFSRDMVSIRATARYGFAFPAPTSIVRIDFA
ncbi:phage major capsid protein [Kineococcus terrestris]|uniref:phage major capsid protein n=1 Tax=Kineococcus terrestris TaxID=2044856 RepID=UPI0034DAE444